MEGLPTKTGSDKGQDQKPPDDLKIMGRLLEMFQDIFSTLDSKEILYRIVTHVAAVIRVVRCSILVVDEKKQTAKVLATYEDPDIEEFRIDLRKYPEISTAVREEKVVFVQDVTRDPLVEEVRDSLLALGIRSILVVPLLDMEKRTGNLLGTLYLRTSSAAAVLTDSEIQFCRVAAQMAAIALKNSYLFQRVNEERRQLETLAVTDDLTRLYNHRFFFQRLREEFKRASRHRSPLSCIMADIDDFKKINDRFGHPEGDVILQEVARLIQGNIRETDIPARYGGEEFAVILPHTTAESAVLLAHRIRQAVKKFPFTGLPEGHGVTLSLGIATSPHPSIRRAEDLLKMADRSLYEAKVLGKDRVEIVTP